MNFVNGIDMNEGFVLNVAEYGAKGDGVTFDTVSIQQAIDQCSANGGGKVLFGAGEYLTGTIFLKSNVQIYLSGGAKIIGSKDINDYSDDIVGCCFRRESHLDKCLIYAEGQENISITGGGTIDGQGWAFPIKVAGDESSALRPMLIRLVSCKKVVMRDVYLKNAGSWCTNFVFCENVKVDGVTIRNRVNRNNDGFDINGCRGVLISNCNLSCSDDGVALQNTREDRICRDIVITNCVISSRWAAIRCNFSAGGVKNVTVSNCIFYDTYGCAIKLQADSKAFIENMKFSNLIMDNVTGPISLRHGKHSWNESDATEQLGFFRNISFNNIRASVAAKPVVSETEHEPMEGEVRSCISIIGNPDGAIENISFKDVDITFPGGGTAEEACRMDIPYKQDEYPEYFMYGVLCAYGLYARHAKGICLGDVKFRLASEDMRAAIVCDKVEDMEICGFGGQGGEGADCLVKLRDCREAFLHGCRPLNDIKTFLSLEGEKTGGINLRANNLNRAKESVKMSGEVDGSEVLEK